MASGSVNYEIRPVRESDLQGILDHLRAFFYRDAPLASYLKIVTDENPICEEFEQSSMKSMENPSQNLVAISNGKIVGICLNEILDKNYIESDIKKQFKDKRYGMIEDFLSMFEKQANLFGKYPDFEKVFFIHNVSVDRSYRGCGIAQALCMKSIELAKQLGYGLISSNAASYYTASIFDKLGMDVVHSYNYTDYKINGEVVFRPAAPHKAMVMYAKKIA